ncbi:MAG: sugar ABC transporter permease [Chloroflexi bacterium]|nr:sugar ABC transporter permease [Chloroflexota bacterium]
MRTSDTTLPGLGKSSERWSVLFQPRRRHKWDRVAVLFVLPWLLHLGIFTFYPLIIALLGSVADWNILTGEMKFVGMKYYAELPTDPLFFKAIRNSFVYLIFQVPSSITGGIFVALLLNQRGIKGRMIFRGIYFLPVIVTGAVLAIIWQWMYSTNSGVLNYFLSLVGVQPMSWLTSERLSMPSIALMKIWTDIGFYGVIFLAALQGIPQEIMDAAQVDGANNWQNLWYVKLPLLNPVIVFSVVMGTLWGLNIFTEPLLMTDGGPMGSSLTTLLYLYHVGFIWSRIGYANAIGVASTLMILLLTFIERRLLERATY